MLGERYIGFIENLKNSGKSLLKLIFSSCSQDQRSLTGQNLRVLLTKYVKASVDHLIGDKDLVKKAKVLPLPEEEVWKISMIEEICLAKKEYLDIEFDKDDLKEISEYICTG